MRDNTKRADGNVLGSAPLGGLICRFAIPSIVAMLVNAAYNITDQIFIGHVVGMLGNAATNVAFPVVSLTIGLALMAGAGTAANFNICLGAKQEEEAKCYVGTGLTLMLLFGVALAAVVLLFKTPILLLCGATENVLPYAQLYLGVTGIGLPFMLFTSASSVLIRADRSPTYSMLCTISGAVLNVFLDWLFLFRFGWGIRGAAAATVTGQFVSFAMCACYFPRFRTFPIRLASLRLRSRYVRQIMKLGVTNLLNHMVMMLVNIVMNNTLTHYGALSVYGSDIPLAVSGVIAKLNQILTAFSVGLAQGCQPIWSFNMGARNYDRVKSAYLQAAAAAMCISLLAFALFQTFPRQIVSIFGGGTEAYFEFAERYMRVFMMMVCVLGIQPLTMNYFTSIGDVRRGIFLSLSRQGFLLLPLLIALPLAFGLNGVLYAGPIADALAFLLSVTLVARSFRKMTSLPAPDEAG